MTSPAGGRFTLVGSVTAVGTVGPYQFKEPIPGNGFLLQVEASSFNLQVKGTNMFNHLTGVGSFWRNISPVITTPGIYYIQQVPAAVLLQVNSLASGDRLIGAFGQ